MARPFKLHSLLNCDTPTKSVYIYLQGARVYIEGLTHRLGAFQITKTVSPFWDVTGLIDGSTDTSPGASCPLKHMEVELEIPFLS